MFRIGKACRYAASLILVLLLLNNMPVMSVNIESRDVISKTKKSLNIRTNDPHGPIAIDGDANFSATALAEDWSGDGSAQDPYIIENYDITLGVTPEASISIANTRANYTIRGCRLIGPAATPSYGIYLENSTNGQIINNMITNFANGLYVISESKNVVATGNNISYNSDSIYWEDSGNLTITQNHCSNNFFMGIYILNSDEGTISGNNCSGNGIHGIQLHFSNDHTLTDNICNENTGTGLRLENALDHTLENNTSSENEIGILTAGSLDNFIQWNIFKNNTLLNGASDGLPSIWDYNYWSDYVGSDANSDGIGDTSYFLNGDIDHTPLMFPPFPVEWAQPITDQHIEFGSDFQYSIAVICPAPYDLWMNDSTNFWLDMEIIFSGTTLDVGDYPLAVNATNIYGYLTEAIFTVIVRDTTPPTMTHPDDFSYRVDDDTEYELQWTLSDLSPLTFILLRNGTEVTSYDVPITPIFFTTNIGNIRPGVYNFTMVAEDIWGNVATDMVLVTILPIPFLEVMLPWLIVGIVAVVIVFVIVIILRKRRSIKTE
ncbi:MAG: right-handed parallel beta-helix repeat-containing protein [Candidatus Thorarchaeota archaeon]|jgi:parallel beta-helix repeat protein